MQAGNETFDPATVVVVPARPGPLRRLDDARRGRDDVDDVLDDLFGEPDQRGPSLADAVLVTGGATAIVAGQVASLPVVVTVLGVGAAGLGLILPARSLWRRAAVRRRTRRLGSVVGDGMLLRTDDDVLRRIVAAHERITDCTTTDERGERARGIAHAAAHEVAGLLEGRVPVTAAEREYVAARAVALDELAATLADPALPPADHVARRAQVEARREVEAIAGSSSLTDAAALVRDLRNARG